MTGRIFNIQKFCLHDGPGIRTTVFFKGCNLRCAWCANPESAQMGTELTLDPRKCVLCGACAESCPADARYLAEGKLQMDKNLCNLCGKCVAACVNRAIGVEGREVTVEDVLQEVRKDKVFYETSGGGVTLSGGEVLLQIPFATKLAKALRKEGVLVAIETAGAVSSDVFGSFLQEIDYVLMDLKHYDEKKHLAGTGADNRQILENLRVLAQSGKPFLVRIPVIPGFNDSLDDAVGFAKTLTKLGVYEAELLPFHQLGQHKYHLLNKDYAYEEHRALLPEELQSFAQALRDYGITVKY